MNSKWKKRFVVQGREYNAIWEDTRLIRFKTQEDALTDRKLMMKYNRPRQYRVVERWERVVR